jgi:hypothetical protein
MKMIEFFIPRKLSFDGGGIQSQRAGILEGQSVGQIKTRIRIGEPANMFYL